MSFACDCELEIQGGAEADRRTAARIILAADCVAEELGASEAEDSVRLRFSSVDGIPEDELASAAPQFPELSFALAYFSKDGEFFGYSRTGVSGQAGESEDFDDGTLEKVASQHSGDGIAFVRSFFGLR